MADARRIVLAHGFTQTARSWQRFQTLLAERAPGIESLALDLPGHGGAELVTGDLWGTADHLVERGGSGTYVGYSMGGRVVLHAALTHPEAVRSLVVIGATAGIDDDDERAARRVADERLAERIEAIGVEAFVDEWLTNPLFAGLTVETRMREDRLRNTATGLASSLRTTGTGTQEPLWDRLGDLDQPALVIVGEEDDKFTEIGRRLADTIPRASLSVIGGAGHSVHLERPEETVGAIIDWLARI